MHRWNLAVLIILLALTTSASPSLSKPVHVCGRATAVMPSAEAHRRWLEENTRYGPEAAKEFADRVKRYGPNVLNYQIIIHEEPGTSGFFDAEGANGLHEAKVKTIKSLSCRNADHPLALLVGLHAVAISQAGLLVAKKPRAYEIISLAGLNNDKPIPLRLAGPKEGVICRNIRSCDGIAARWR
jgi:hypothetical protein